MLIIGLTGSIGMGKSTTAQFFRDAGIPVHDADYAVHELYEGEAAPLIDKAFPNTMREGKVNRDALFSHLVNSPLAMKQLEAIIHPLVKQHREEFMAKAIKAGARIIVLDVPLLFETATDKDCDIILVVSAPLSVQKQRVLARVGMTEERFEIILSKQMPDSQKRHRAHFVIDTGRGLEHVAEKCERFSAQNMRQSKDLECAFESIKIQNALNSAKQQVNDVLRCLAPVFGHKF